MRRLGMPGKAPLNVETLAEAVSNVEWRWMENEGRFPAPNVMTYERGIRKQLRAMSEQERWDGPMSNPKIAAEYSLLSGGSVDEAPQGGSERSGG
jgi:hypothetical protein